MYFLLEIVLMVLVVFCLIFNFEFLKYLKVIFDREFVNKCWKFLFFLDVKLLDLKFGYIKYFVLLFRSFCIFGFIFFMFLILFVSLFLFCFLECCVKIKIYFEKKGLLNLEIMLFRNCILDFLYFVKG